MARPYDRQATLVALVNAAVVMLLPIAFASGVALFRRDPNGSTVVGYLPAGEHYRKLAQFWVSYVIGVSPFAMAAAWRTFVHTKRWFESGAVGWRGVLEAGACGFIAAVIVLLPGILTRPLQAPPYVIAYGGISAVLGLVIGVVLWTTATLAVRLFDRAPTLVGIGGERAS
jgi:hypothetical protein